MHSGRLPAWAWVIGAWALLVAAGVVLELRWGLALDTCLFHRITGHPCPTCGSTRSVLALLRGDWLASLRASPFLWITAGVSAGLGLFRWRKGPGSIRVPERVRPWLLGLGVAILLANWIWVLRTT